MQRNPSHATTKLMLFTVSKDERNTKEDSGECVLWYAKRGTSRAEATSNNEKIKPIALAVIELC